MSCILRPWTTDPLVELPQRSCTHAIPQSRIQWSSRPDEHDRGSGSWALPRGGARVARQQALGRHHHPTGGKPQVGAQVNLQRRQHVLLGCEHGPQIGPHGARKDTRGVHRRVMLHFWLVFSPPAACGDRSRESGNSPRYCTPQCDGILL